MTKSVLIVKESTATETINELKEAISREPVLIKIMPDLEFDLSFKKTVDVPVNLDDETIAALSKIAHGRDITLNTLINEVLLEKVSEGKKMSFVKGMTPNAETGFTTNEAIEKEIDKTINGDYDKKFEKESELPPLVDWTEQDELKALKVDQLRIARGMDENAEINSLIDNITTSL